MTDAKLLDTILIERGQLGDTDAIDELLKKNHGKAFLYAMRMTRHVEDAADLVSEGFIRIHRAIGRFQADSSFSTWMYKIIRNCFLDSYKKKRVQVIASLDAAVELEGNVVFAQPIDESESPFDASARSEYQYQVRAAVDRLPIHQRRLMLMYHADNLTYDEMAALLDMPAGTIKSRLHRARSNLRGIIEGDVLLSSSLVISA
jgi:RNA polymerase sigma-70 factor, ECF subfamily